MIKWYMHNPESFLENDTHKLLRDYDIQMDHLISARQPDLRMINNNKKKKKKKREFAGLWTLLTLLSRLLTESVKKDKYFELTRELQKLWKVKVTFILGTVTQGLIKGLGNKRASRDHPNNCIIVIGQHTEKSPGDLRRLVVTQTPVKDYQLKMM